MESYLTYAPNGKTVLKTELFDLSADIGEENNIAAAHPEKIQELSRLRDKARSSSEFYPFSGRSWNKNKLSKRLF